MYLFLSDVSKISHFTTSHRKQNVGDLTFVLTVRGFRAGESRWGFGGTDVRESRALERTVRGRGSTGKREAWGTGNSLLRDVT